MITAKIILNVDGMGVGRRQMMSCKEEWPLWPHTNWTLVESNTTQSDPNGAKFLDGERNECFRHLPGLTVNSSAELTLGTRLIRRVTVVKGEVTETNQDVGSHAEPVFMIPAGNNSVFEGAGGSHPRWISTDQRLIRARD